MDIWSWFVGIRGTTTDQGSNSLELARSKFDRDQTRSRSIQLGAQRSLGSNNGSFVTFSVCVQGFNPKDDKQTLWESCACDLSSNEPFLPLILQLVREIMDRSPTSTISTGHGSQVIKLRPEPVARLLETYSPESFSSFFTIIFITRLFWLCACDAPTEVGSLYFDGIMTPGLDLLSREKYASVFKTFLISVGVDVELSMARAVGYVVTKWLMLKQLRVGLQCLAPQVQPSDLGISYAYESHGLWVLKGYAPVQSMKPTCHGGAQSIRLPFVDPAEVALRYALAHQQLEAVIQMEYTVICFDCYIQVTARVDNLRFHVVKLGSTKKDDVEDNEEVYFPSRVQVWVGPELGSTYVQSMSISNSTMNVERHNETQKVMKGTFAKSKTPKIKALARTSTRMKTKNWRCDQDVEGNTVIYDAIFYDNKSGLEVFNMKPSPNKEVNAAQRFGDNLRYRYRGANRPFLKSGGLILGGDECKGEAKWRLSKEVERSDSKWRIGGKVWVSYWPNNNESSFSETRCIEWCHEIELPLVPTKSMN